jgi:hypothetical protein
VSTENTHIGLVKIAILSSLVVKNTRKSPHLARQND